MLAPKAFEVDRAACRQNEMRCEIVHLAAAFQILSTSVASIVAFQHLAVAQQQDNAPALQDSNEAWFAG